MSCNGCRVLRKRCSDSCVLRSCLHWIETPGAQANATLFLAKFFGRSDLLSFISAIPEPQRPALFRSLLYEACGRKVNPVNGAVGLLWSGNWHVCQAAVDTVLAGGVLRPVFEGSPQPSPASSGSTGRSLYQLHTIPFTAGDQGRDTSYLLRSGLVPREKLGGPGRRGCRAEQRRDFLASFWSEEEESSGMTSLESSEEDDGRRWKTRGVSQEMKLLNLFV